MSTTRRQAIKTVATSILASSFIGKVLGADTPAASTPAAGTPVTPPPPPPIHFPPFVWKSEPPADCPFPPSNDLKGVRLLGNCSNYQGLGDTWYPSWAADDRLYSSYTDGQCPRPDGGMDTSSSNGGGTTGNAVLEGDDPLTLKVYSLGLQPASAGPYGGRYPCGGLVYNGVWYYGTYCIGPSPKVNYGGMDYNWPWMGPVVGYRMSKDYGKTWEDTKNTPDKPLFGESGLWGYPIKIGDPHFVDFGKNMEHSPDGKAYLVANGGRPEDPITRFASVSWASGNQIYLIRVTPTPENINDGSKYEFFAGNDASGKPQWTSDFKAIKPLIEWYNKCGNVTMTYNPGLRRYLMCVNDAWPTVEKTRTFILESENITGPWRMVTYMRDFGEQGYFPNIPSKFISSDGRKMWLCYSANFATNWNGMNIATNPPGSHYGLVLQEMELI